MDTNQEKQLSVLEASYKEYRDFQFSEFAMGIKVSLGCAVVLFPFLLIFKSMTYSLIASVIIGLVVFLLLVLFASYKHFMHCRQLDCAQIDVLQRRAQAYPHLSAFVTNQVKKNGHLVMYDAVFVELVTEQYKKKKILKDIAQTQH